MITCHTCSQHVIINLHLDVLWFFGASYVSNSGRWMMLSWSQNIWNNISVFPRRMCGTQFGFVIDASGLLAIHVSPGNLQSCDSCFLCQIVVLHDTLPGRRKNEKASNGKTAYESMICKLHDYIRFETWYINIVYTAWHIFNIPMSYYSMSILASFRLRRQNFLRGWIFCKNCNGWWGQWGYHGELCVESWHGKQCDP